jgi:hypothetical protein
MQAVGQSRNSRAPEPLSRAATSGPPATVGRRASALRGDLSAWTRRSLARLARGERDLEIFGDFEDAQAALRTGEDNGATVHRRCGGTIRAYPEPAAACAGPRNLSR